MGVLVKVYSVVKLCFASFAISAAYAVLLVYELEKILPLSELIKDVFRVVLFVFLLFLNVRYLFAELVFKAFLRPFRVREIPSLIVYFFNFLSSLFCAEVAVQAVNQLIDDAMSSSFYPGAVGFLVFVIAYIIFHKCSRRSL